MYEILIVDDHIHQVESLATTLPWETVGITTIHKAYSGRQALEIITSHPIDILITDIRMPELSGLELIEAARQHNPELYCILLTGYAQFEYAQKAIELQAIHYFVKPVEDDELLQVVAQVTQRLQARPPAEPGPQRQLQVHLPVLRKKLLTELLSAELVSTSELKEKLLAYDLPFQIGDEAQLLLLDMDRKLDTYSRLDRSLIAYSIGNIVEETLQGSYDCWGADHSQAVAAFLLRAKPRAGDTDADEPQDGEPDGDRANGRGSNGGAASGLASSIERIRDNIRTYLKMAGNLYVSDPLAFPGELAEAYRRGISLLDKHSAQEQSGMLLGAYWERPQELPIRHVRSLHTHPTFPYYMETQHWDGFRDKLAAVFSELRQEHAVSRLQLSEVYVHVWGHFITLAHKHGYVLEEMLGYQTPSVDGGVRTLGQLEDWSYTVFDLIRERAGEDTTGTAHARIVETVQRIIDSQLSDNVTLQALADKVYLHPAYLSKIYKERTGENISGYILRARMQAARELLRDPQLKIYEIAVKVGYHSPQHFIREFKKYYRETPKSYRKGNNE